MVQGSVGYRKVRLLDEEYYLSYAPSPKLSWSVGTLVEKKKVTKAAGEARSRMLGQMDELRSSFRRLFIGEINPFDVPANSRKYFLRFVMEGHAGRSLPLGFPVLTKLVI